MSAIPDFSSMNETDVREIIVRPLIESLGYRHGTEANIRTEQFLRYGKAFLGRKNPSKDPDLVGRADYICEVISFGRWVVEVKSPAEAITQDVVEQAHTYAAHPEIAASHFLVTNGREFKLFQTSRLEYPTLAWCHENTEENRLRISNLLSPDAVRARAKASLPDAGKPLGRGLASRLTVIGGEIQLEDHFGDNPFLPTSSIAGLRLPVVGGYVRRTDDNRIIGHVQIAKAAPLLLGDGELADRYDFISASEYISDDTEQPTIFQNLTTQLVPVGKQLNIPGIGKIPLPFEYSSSAFTEAVGFITGGKFVGTMRVSHDFDYSKMSPPIRQMYTGRFGNIPDHCQVTGVGRFEISLL
jgi:hypothetical protein